MYRLTLTIEDRKAIDWVGDRDWNGHDLFQLLWCHPVTSSPDDADWDDERDITCLIPEHVAWEIRDLCEENGYGIPHFAEDLTEKLLAFFDSIV